MAFSIKQPRKGYYTSRRGLLKWGLLGLGTFAVSSLPKALMAQTPTVKTLTFNADDVGILNFALLLEELEAAFYQAAVNSGRITNAKEVEYLRNIGNNESEHAAFLRNVLGNNVTFQASDLSFNQSGLGNLLRDRDTILNTAVTLEDLGVHAYNGAGTSLTNPTFLLAAGSIVSVEGRHSAAVRSLLGRPVTELPSEQKVSDANLVAAINPVRGRAYDELFTPRQVVEVVGSFNVLNNPIAGALVA